MDIERLESLDVEALTSELEEHEMYEKLLSCVDKLSPKSKEIIWLFFYEGMTAPEIAEKLQQPVTSIYTAKKRALKQLANMLKNKKQPVTSNSLVLLFWLYLTTP